MANQLIHSSSPYLLQHAHNPVNWYEWGREALEKAKTENKPIIVSIGYSACHWCHVMERESFESIEIANTMNDNFICIKVDREERPDIDAIYMEAIQNMGLRGGWPLNVFLTTNAQPFYGCTYFPPQNWQNILNQITNAYSNDILAIEKSALSFTESLNRSEASKYGLIANNDSLSRDNSFEILQVLAIKFDNNFGGMDKSPKFPMPSIYIYLLRLWRETNSSRALNHVVFTLKSMALGGLYDQIGGGFARYSTDEKWFLPHFEKMLYDNGQLISLYSEAYQITKEPLFKKVVYETISFVERELTNPYGGFYSALDADSEGEEGKFYVWTKQEIDSILGGDSTIFCEYYNVSQVGNWENGNNILFCNQTIEEFCAIKSIDISYLTIQIEIWKSKLLMARANRIRPGLDNKILASWNGLMLNGIIDAFRIFNEPKFLTLIKKNANFIQNNLIESTQNDTKILHSKSLKGIKISGFLEDYAFVIQAYINLYQATSDEHWLHNANELTKYVLIAFNDPNEDFLYFTDLNSEVLIARKKEIFDNVIPASNSQMFNNLYILSKFFDNEHYLQLTKNAFGKINKMLFQDPAYLSNWGILGLLLANATSEIIINGKNSDLVRIQLDQYYFPNKIIAYLHKNNEMNLPILEGKIFTSETLIYVCKNKTCSFPVNNIEEVLKLLL